MVENKIINGDSLVELSRFDNDSIDLIVTDPPYGYSFMGKDWDKAVPSVEIWKECFRVLKPGAFAFIMSAPRQDVLSQMIIRLGEAGFETNFTSIYWTYATGFPKATNMGKLVDKRLGNERQVIGVSNNEKDFRDLGKKTKEVHGLDKLGVGINASRMPLQITKGSSDFEGAYGGYQPKPAVEIIIVVMKPIEKKTYVEQALANGKGVTWIDDCRIPYMNQDDLERYDYNRRGLTERSKLNVGDKITEDKTYDGGWKKGDSVSPIPVGRFPANLIVSDDILNDGTINKGQAGATRGDEPSTLQKGNTYGDYSGYGKPTNPRGDSGSLSRYFDIDLWWDMKVQELPDNVKKIFPFLYVSKASKRERNEGLGDMADKKYQGRFNNSGKWTEMEILAGKNNHPTVKPLKLMSYLVTLGSREGDLILDPFAGSGTTLLAASILNRRWVGIELEEEYAKIAQERIKYHTSNKRKV